MRIRNLALTSSALSLVLGLTAQTARAAPALPAGGALVAGGAKISSPASGQLTINQTTNRAVIDWTSFGVGQGGTVTFDQPGAGSATLNRVTGGATSRIAGEIEANGSVFLINPNGIEITKSGVVDVGRGFVASTLDMANSDFLVGKGVFAGNGGAVANAGTITTGAGGYVGLLGGAVGNSGMIAAPAGQVMIGAARAATLDLNGGAFLQVTLPASAALSSDGSAALLSTAAAQAAARSAVNLPGAVNAQAVSGRNGDVTLSGSIVAAGGSITVSAPGEIALNGASLDTSSAAGGGAIRIGGKGGPVQASSLSVDASSVLSANGGLAGAGGAVSLWSTGQTDFAGAISAQGGALGGDGGSAEVSGGVVNYAGTTNLLAANGKTGDLLIDPFNVTISSGTATGTGFTASANNTVINATTLDTALKTASVTVSTGTAGTQAGTITVSAPIAWSSASTLTLSAASSIAVDAAITSTGAGSLVLRADNAGVGTGTVTFGAGDKVNFSGSTGVAVFYYNPADNPAGSKVETTSYIAPTNFSADVTTNASKSGQFTAYMLVNTVYDLQNIENNITGDYALGRNIDATVTDTWNPGTVNNQTVHGGFSPIQFSGNVAFTGVLNGQNHTISNLFENWGSGGLGLFGFVGATGVVENVNLTGVSLFFNPGAIYGGVVAAHNQGLIVNDSATGTLTSAIEGPSGGLVGYNDSTGKITGSHSSVTVNYNGPQTDQGTDFGGLVGESYGVVENSFATGAVSDLADSANVGGLIGFNNGSEGAGLVESSYATGKVTGGASALGGGSNVGGLVGYDLGAASTKEATPPTPGASGPTLVPGEIYLSYATGAVVDTGAHAFVGGLVGEVDQNGGLLADYATGAVTGGSDGAYGGLAGVSDNGGGVVDSYASGNVTVGIGDEVGGLVGLNAGDGGIIAGWAWGNVTAGAADATNAYAAKAGGLVGYNQTLISGAYAMGNVTVGATTSTSEGAIAYAGGLVGNDYGGTLNEVYSLGQVKGGAGSMLGGLSGGPGAGVTAGYWDTQTSGLSTSPEGTGQTTAQLQAALPSGFGSDSWGIIAGKSFPYLLVQFKSIATGVSEGTPEVVSGTLSGFTSDVGLRVALQINGKPVALAAELPSALNGYYYALLAPGTIAAAGGNKVLVDVSDGADFDDIATGSITGLNIEARTLNLITGAARYSTLDTEIDEDLGLPTSTDGVGTLVSDFSISKTSLDSTNAAGFILDHTVNTTGLTIVTAAGDPLTIADEVALTGTGTLDLDAGGALDIDAPIAVTAGGKVVLGYSAVDFERGPSGFVGSLSYAKGTGEGVAGQALTINGTAYKLLYSMTDIAGANGSAGHDAIAAAITATTHYTAAVAGSFSGVLEGLGNSISGLTIDSTGDHVGLIGTLAAGAVVRDLRVAGGAVEGLSYVGELVGYNSGTIANAMASGSATDTSGGAGLGGLVGYNTGTVSGSAASVTVKNTGSGFATGGLVGFNASGAQVSTGSASGAVSGGASEMGGLVGYNAGVINVASAAGAVTGPSDLYVGGLVGYNATGAKISSGLVSGATVSAIGGTDVGGLAGANFGTVTGSTASDTVVNNDHGHSTGGLVGYNAAGASIASSAAAGNVDVGDGVSFVGGLVGYNNGLVSDDSATAVVSAPSSLDVGGLVGYNYTAGEISSSFASAASLSAAGGDAVGGLAGYNGGAIANTYADIASLTGATYVGGLVGYDHGAVSTSWSSGKVSGTTTVGGSIGDHVSGTLTDVYWDEGTSGKTVGVGAGLATGLTGIGGATGHSPDAQATYAGFNFTTTWTIDAGTSRPFLKDPAPKTPPN